MFFVTIISFLLPFISGKLLKNPASATKVRLPGRGGREGRGGEEGRGEGMGCFYLPPPPPLQNVLLRPCIIYYFSLELYYRCFLEDLI